MDDPLERLRRAHAETTMVGWDFSRLDGRMTAAPPPWDFEADCRAALAGARSAVDLGTGGGERLLALLAAVRPSGRVVATEGWAPNVPVARAALAPVEVREYDAEAGRPMPFDDGELDLVMSRHEALDPAELARTLTPGGRLLTQQVHGLDVPELRAWFGGEPAYPNVTTERMAADLSGAGLRVELAQEWSGPMVFADARALVTYLAMVPWDVAEFDVDRHAKILRELDAGGPIEVTQRRFRIHATRL